MPSILLVDDEKNVLKTLSISLRRYDYAVQQAQNGPDALKILEESPCDFIVSDIRMTPMDGYKLAAAVRRRFPDVDIIFMSAYGSDDRNGRPEGLEHFPRLTKPFPVADLVRILQEKQNEKTGRVPAYAAPLRLLLFGEGEQGERIFRQLRSMGFTVELRGPDGGDSLIERDPFDLFVLDGRMLDGGKWTLLNKIDRAAPQKPVLVIADCENGQGKSAETNASPAVIDRRLIFDAPERTREFILSHLMTS